MGARSPRAWRVVRSWGLEELNVSNEPSGLPRVTPLTFRQPWAVEDLQVLLDEWAQYVVGRLSITLGLPSASPYCRLILRNEGAGSYSPNIPERAMDTDRMVRKLGEKHPDLRLAIEMSYLGTGTAMDRAAALGYTRRTLERKVETALQVMLSLYAERLENQPLTGF